MNPEERQAESRARQAAYATSAEALERRDAQRAKHGCVSGPTGTECLTHRAKFGTIDHWAAIGGTLD